MTTATAPSAPRASVPATSSRPLAGTPALIRFILRRDRLRIPAWLLILTAITVATAASFADLYPTAAQRQAMAESLRTPAGLAMSGPSAYLDDYTLGSMMGHQMLGFMAAVVAVMSVLLVVRHTRAEEESGRAELVRASVVGRHAPVAAAVLVVVAVNLALAGLMAVGLGALGLEGVTWTSSLLYGMAHAAVGIVFVGVAAVAAQVTGYARGAAALGLAGAGLAYAVRAVGDAGPEALSWLSPIGWAQATYAYADDRWWPLAIAGAVAAALLAAAMRLSLRRDVGAGLRPARPGSATASALLARPVGLALRLHRGLLAGFVAALALIGVAYGSILAELDEMLSAVEGIEEMLADIGGATLVESYLSMIMVIMAVIVSVYGVLAALRPRSEERAGRAEALLATPVSRARWVASHLVVALVGSTLVLLSAGVATGLAGAAALADPGLVGDLGGAALAYAPAVWVTVGVAVALYGWAPRAATLAWVLPAYAFLVGYLGQILQFPEWSARLSPFAHVPQLPAEDLVLAPLAWLAALAAALLGLGLAGIARRDLTPG